ncbi:MAG: MFS transporter [Pseudolabrys sp.]|nr:MFS transporter [Pseudolabrys sp.]
MACRIRHSISAKNWTLVVTILGSSIAFIDGSVVGVAQPAIEASLGTDAAAVQWVVNAYQLSLSALMLVGGAAGDRYGRRLIFVMGLALFALASAACGLSQSSVQLIVFRAIQGIGAALLVPSSLAIIGATFKEKERGKAIGTWAAASALSAAVGPILGGFLVDHASWHWIFLINPALALPALWLANTHMPESRNKSAPSSLDWLGALLAFAGLGGAVFALIASTTLGWRSLWVSGAMAGGILLLIVFVWVEWKSAAPMMPLGLFRSHAFSGINLLTLLLYAALGGAMFFLPFDLIVAHGYAAAQAGAVFVPFTVIMAALSRWSGGLLDRFGARPPLIVGPIITAAGYVLLAFSRTSDSYALGFLLPVSVIGLGMTIAVAPLTTAVINAAPKRQVGVASGVNNAVASVARLLAVALLGAAGVAAYNNGIDARLPQSSSPAVRVALVEARGHFSDAGSLNKLQDDERHAAQEILRASLGDGTRVVMFIACGLSLGAAVCGAISSPSTTRRRRRA